MHINMTRWLRFSLALMVLGAAIHSEQVFGMFDFRGWYLGLAMSAIVLVGRFRITAPMLLSSLVIVIPSMLALFQGFYDTWKPFLIFSFFIFLLSYADALVRSLGHEAIIEVFAKACLFHACFVLLNQVLYIVSPERSIQLFGDIDPISFLTRARGLLIEPSEAALYLSPALIYYFLKRDYLQYLIVFLAMVVTFSSLTYMAIALAVVLVILMRRLRPMSAFTLGMVALILFVAAVTSPQIADRVDTIARIDMRDPDFENYNSSVATILMNSIVAVDSLFGSAFLGVGFGNFEYGFNMYAEQYFPSKYIGEGLFWNRNTGGSLLVRAVAELGLLGLATIGYVLYRLGRAYLALRKFPRDKEGLVARQAYVVSAIVVFAICLLRKDSLTNVHMLVLIVGTLRLPLESTHRLVPTLDGARAL